MCGAVHDPIRANVYRAGVGLGGGDWGAAAEHDLSVADRCHEGEALLVRLAVSGRGAVPGAVAGVGAAPPLGGAVGASPGGERVDGRGRDQEKGRPTE